MTANTDLLSSGLLDSLFLVQPPLFTEEAASSKINLLNLNPNESATLGGLYWCAAEVHKGEIPSV